MGAALAAAWSLRHTIFKVIVCVALLLTFLIAAVVSLPSIVINPTWVHTSMRAPPKTEKHGNAPTLA